MPEEEEPEEEEGGEGTRNPSSTSMKKLGFGWVSATRMERGESCCNRNQWKAVASSLEKKMSMVNSQKHKRGNLNQPR